MSRSELVLLRHRLTEMATIHEAAADQDEAADTAETLIRAIHRKGVLCAGLFREAVALMGEGV